jgi:hypothetical protein
MTYHLLPASAYDVIARMKAEILEDIASGRVPASIKSFEGLDDFVDANCYGGFCDDDEPVNICTLNETVGPARAHEFVTYCQRITDTWLKRGRPRFNPLTPVHIMGMLTTHKDEAVCVFMTDDFGNAFQVTPVCEQWKYSCASDFAY